MLKKNLFYNSLLSASQFIFPLITFPYSSRILGPEGIGTVNFIDSFTQYFILFAALGIPLYGVREISKRKGDKEKLDKTFSEIFFIHIISAAIFSVTYLLLAWFIPQLRVHLDLVIVGIIMIVFGVLSAEWVFQGMEQFAYITSRSLTVRCLSVLALFIFLKHNSPPIVYYSVMASGIVLNGLVNIYYLRKLVKISFKGLHLKQHIKPLIIILGSTLAVSVYLLMDNVILGFMKGDKAVGIYGTALRIVRLPLAITGAVNGVMIPQISRAFAKRDFKEINSLINKSFSIICVTGFPIMVGMYVSSSFLIQSLAGNKFVEAVSSLQILAPLVIVIGFANIICLQLLAPIGRERYLLKAYVITMIFSLLVNILLIKYFSYKGASVGMISTEIFATGLCYYYLQKIIDIKFEKKILMQSLAGSLCFFPIALIVKSSINGFIQQGIIVIISCVIFYTVFLWWIKNTYIENMKAAIISKLFNSNHKL